LPPLRPRAGPHAVFTTLSLILDRFAEFRAERLLRLPVCPRPPPGIGREFILTLLSSWRLLKRPPPPYFFRHWRGPCPSQATQMHPVRSRPPIGLSLDDAICGGTNDSSSLYLGFRLPKSTLRLHLVDIQARGITLRPRSACTFPLSSPPRHLDLAAKCERCLTDIFRPSFIVIFSVRQCFSPPAIFARSIGVSQRTPSGLRTHQLFSARVLLSTSLLYKSG